MHMLIDCHQQHWVDSSKTAQVMLSQSIDQFVQEIESLQEQFNDKNADVETLEKQNAQLKDDLRQSKLELQQESNKNAELKRKVDALESESQTNNDARVKLDRLRERWTNFAAHFGPDIEEPADD